MRMHSKLILAALAASMLLAIGVTGASAGRLRVNERNFELIWNEGLGAPKTKLRFTPGTGPTVECRVTLLGRFVESTIKKETTIRQSTINHGELEGCTGGTATIRTETMPWESRYRSFEGTLPRIRSITIGLIGAFFRIREPNGVECEAQTTVANPGVGIAGNSAGTGAETGLETTGEAENIRADETAGIPLGGEFLCGFAGIERFSGVGLIRNLPRTAKLRITLI